MRLSFVILAISLVSRLLAESGHLAAKQEEAGHRRSLTAATANITQDPFTCDAPGQRLALLFFYNATNGPAWHNNSGWPSIAVSSPEALIMHMASIPVTTNTCIASDGSNLVLPDHCCWHGVSCCTTQAITCGINPYCNCSTSGLVTALILNRNNASNFCA